MADDVKERRKHWIAGAVKHPGALTKQAHRAGESVSEFAHKHDEGNSKTAKRARLAETFAKMRGRR